MGAPIPFVGGWWGHSHTLMGWGTYLWYIYYLWCHILGSFDVARLCFWSLVTILVTYIFEYIVLQLSSLTVSWHGKALHISHYKILWWATTGHQWICRADSRFVPSQWETVLLCNNVSHWLGANLESALDYPHKGSAGCPAVREKSGKFQTWQKSGNFVEGQGKKWISGKVREKSENLQLVQSK